MKGRVFKRIMAIAIAFCMIFNLIPMPTGNTVIEAEAVGGISSLTCASFISNTTRRNYIDVMMKHYLNTNSKLTSTLDAGNSVVFMFEGGSDNYSSVPYQDAIYTTRTQAVVIVVKKNASGNAYIDYYNESCSSIPDDANWTSGGDCDMSTTVLDGIYTMYTCNHNGRYAAFNLDDARRGWYCPSPGATGRERACSAINVHTRSTNYCGGRSANYAQSMGCQLISYGSGTSNGFNDFMKSVAGITWNAWPGNTFASIWAFKGYYVLDRQLGLVSPSGVEYGTGSLATLYTKGDLDAITKFSTNARASANFSYLDRCTEYASYCNIEVTLDGAPINSLPCSNDTDKSTTLESAVKGDKYVATAMYKNTYGNYWYQIQTKSGKTGYIYGGEVKYLSEMTPDVTLKDATAPNGHVTNTLFYLNGTVKSTYNEITKVESAIYKGFGISGSAVIGGSESVSTKSYTIKGSKVDDDTWFNKIEPGKYTYVIYASYRNYYAEGATTLKSNTGTKTLMAEYFITVQSSTSQSSCNHAYETTVVKAATCTADGSSVKSCPTCGLLSKVTDTKLGHKAGEAVKENEVAGVSYDSVVYCTTCKVEMSRETIKIEQDSSDKEDESTGNADETTDKPEQPSGEGETTAKPEEPSGEGETTAKPEEPSGEGETTVKPEEPSGEGETTAKPEEPSGEGETTDKPEQPSGEDGTTAKPEAPSGEDETTVKPEKPSGENETTDKPEEPSDEEETTNKNEENIRKELKESFLKSEIKDYTYTGRAATQNVVLKDGDYTLVKGVDYSVKYVNNINAGTATVIITGIGDYSECIIKEFKIAEKKVTSAKISITKSKYTYTGKAIKPSVTVKNGNTKLAVSKDYKVSYKNNTKPGTATVTVTFINNYSGSATKDFTITPAKVTGQKQSGFATKNVTITWKKVTGVSGYEIYRSSKKNGTYAKVKSVDSTKNKYKHSNLKSGTTYYYKIRAYKKSGSVYIYGGFSNVMSAVTKPAATTIKATAGKKQATVSWKKVTGAKGYEIYMATSRNGKYKKIATKNASTTKVTKSKLSSGKKYYFKVRAYSKNASGSKVYAGYSSIKSIKVK